MAALTLFRSGRLRPRWTFDASGAIWRLMLSGSGLIVGEDRDEAQKSVAFFAVQTADGVPVWKKAGFGEEWWIGIEAIAGDRLYLHGYRKPDMPGHGGIIAVDLRSGSVLWKHERYAFLAADAEKVLAYRELFERRVYTLIDGKSGEAGSEMDAVPPESGEMRRTIDEPPDLLFPEPLADDSVDFAIVNSLLRNESAPSDGRSGAEWLRFGRFVLLNYYRPLGHGSYSNEFHIFEEASGREVYRDVLDASAAGTAPDSFFVDAGTVYYVRERKTLIAISLGEEES